MKKILIILFFFLTIWYVFALDDNWIVDVYLDLDVNKNEVDYMEFVYLDNSLQESFEKIDYWITHVSDKKLIYFYNKLIEYYLSSKKYEKFSEIINTIIYMTTIELVSRDEINKNYIYTSDYWKFYENKEYWFKILYPAKYKDWTNRNIIVRDNLVALPRTMLYESKIIDKLEEEDNYYFTRSYVNNYLMEKNINNDDEISEFLEKVYWKNCWNFEKYKLENQDWYYLKLTKRALKGENKEWYCVYPWNPKILYYPENEKIITYVIWQEAYYFGNILESVIIEKTLEF